MMAQKAQDLKIDQLLNLKSAGGPRIAPDGTQVAYTVTETDWCFTNRRILTGGESILCW